MEDAYSRCVTKVSSGKSRPLQLTWLDGCKRLREAQWKTGCIGWELNKGLQWLRAAPGRANWSETDACRSAFEGLRGKKRGHEQGRECASGPQRSFVGVRHGKTTVRTTQKRIKASSYRLCSLWTYISDSSRSHPFNSPGNFALESHNGFS